MSATKYEPCPWKQWNSYYGEGPTTTIRSVDGHVICTMAECGDDWVNTHAHLFIAAPELLAELRALVAGIERAAAAGIDLSGHVGTGRALELIARVEGRR